MIRNNLVKDRWKRKRQTRVEYLDKGKDNSQWQGGSASGPYVPPGMKRIGEVGEVRISQNNIILKAKPISSKAYKR